MNIVKKRGWVKNAAIIFLAVMLSLTFFSNTIRNRSLPEVAAIYTQSGSITARIRGSGNVTANESFEVKNGSQTRLIRERPVTKGDEVKIGDVLVTFDTDISSDLDEARSKLREKELQLEELLLTMSRGDNAVANAARAVTSARNALSDAQNTLTSIQYNNDAYTSALAILHTATATAASTQYNFDVAQAELAVLNSIISDGGVVDPVDLETAQQRVRDTTAANSFAQAALALANANLLAAGNRDAWLSATSAVRNAQMTLDEANANLALVQGNENVDSSLENIKLRELRKDIEDIKEQIIKLEKDGSVTEITALVAGIVTAINKNPGDMAEPDETLMVIEVVDRGYSLSFQVSADQATRVSVGDQAEVDRGWWSWGNEIRATLTAIRNDPTNPVAGRILVFSVSGDVESDMQLNITLSQRSENFNIVVPNGAIRSDTNGDFVLLVVSRSSPLGNRYIATRADITIISSDDTNTAIAGALSGWDFVITRSSAPVEPGMEVRLVDNP